MSRKLTTRWPSGRGKILRWRFPSHLFSFRFLLFSFSTFQTFLRGHEPSGVEGGLLHFENASQWAQTPTPDRATHTQIHALSSITSMTCIEAKRCGKLRRVQYNNFNS